MVFEIYFNLHKHVFSVRHRCKVVRHINSFIMKDPKFVVQQGGRNRVLCENRKNVHAFLRGQIVWEHDVNTDYILNSGEERLTEVSYDPYKGDSFYAKKNDKSVDKSFLVTGFLHEGKPRLFATDVKYGV